MIEGLIKADREVLYEQINSQGYGIVSNALEEGDCELFVDHFPKEELFRKTVVMERHQYGRGSYKYYQHPLPDFLQELRENTYELLAPLANQWSKALKLGTHYPDELGEFLQLCSEKDQKLATPLVLKYEQGGYNTLHRDLYGEVYFPMQAIVCLSKAGHDFEGGSLVLTEQRPRAQSKAIVINPKQGDMVVIPTQFRPQKGTQGYYRLHMRHGVSEVTSGIRHTLGVILHDALK